MSRDSSQIHQKSCLLWQDNMIVYTKKIAKCTQIFHPFFIAATSISFLQTSFFAQQKKIFSIFIDFSFSGLDKAKFLLCTFATSETATKSTKITAEIQLKLINFHFDIDKVRWRKWENLIRKKMKKKVEIFTSRQLLTARVDSWD